MARIAIYIGRHLCTAPRPCKEADALAVAGHTVTVHGLWFDARLVRRDELLLADRPWTFAPYADCRPGNVRRRWLWWRLRARHRLARSLFARTGRVMCDAFGYGAAALWRHAAAHPVDLAIFHSEAGLWAAERLRNDGRRVGVDFEDWFSRDLTPAQRSGRPVAELARLEAAALRFSPYVLATSHAMATAMAAAYSGPAPAVIYNTFPLPPLSAKARRDDRVVSLHWFSLLLGPERGLETAFAAFAALPDHFEFHLRADDPGNFFGELLKLIPAKARSRVHLHPTVSSAELPSRLAEHDVGLALDVSTIPSRNLTITNKLFQYLQAGLAVVASDTAGHMEVLRQKPDAGALFAGGDAASLAAALTRLCSEPDRLFAAKHAARRAAETLFAHEHQVPLYTELAAKALATR